MGETKPYTDSLGFYQVMMMLCALGGTGAGQGGNSQGSETKGFMRGEGRMAGEEIAKERERVRRVDQ